MTLNATFQSSNNLKASFASNTEMSGSIESTVYVPVLDEYQGPFEVTPSGQTQTLGTRGFHMPHNVVVNPIPSNYGLITWNGSILTVS